MTSAPSSPRGGGLQRRSLLAGALGLLATAPPLLLGSTEAEAAPNGFRLTPDYRVNWAQQTASTSKARIIQLTNGVRADTPANLADIKFNLALWSRLRTAGDWTISFDYKVLSRLSDPGGTFCCFYFNGVGRGTAQYPYNIANWRGVTPTDEVYFRNSRGLRFSFATANPYPQPGFAVSQLRLRYYNFSSSVLVGEGSPTVFPFTTGVPYRVAVTRRGNRLTVAATDRTTGTTNAYTWTDARIGKWYNGHCGFRWRGQDAELGGFIYTRL